MSQTMDEIWIRLEIFLNKTPRRFTAASPPARHNTRSPTQKNAVASPSRPTCAQSYLRHNGQADEAAIILRIPGYFHLLCRTGDLPARMGRRLAVYY